MANADQIGIANLTPKRGIPATTVGWNNGTARTLTIFTDITKTPLADVAQMNDNSGELASQKRRNKRIQVKFSAKPVGAAATDAQAIAADLPQKMDLVTITAASDSQINCDNSADTAIVDDCSGKYSPEGEFVVDMTVTIWKGKVFAAQS